MKKILIVLLLLTSSFFIFASGTQEAPDTQKISVFTSIIPQEFFVEQIGGDRVEVQALVGPGKSPATYEPTPTQVTKLSKADIFFTIGVAFEKAFLPSVEENLKIKIVDTSAGITKRFLEAHSHDEDHDDDDEHEANTVDPHIWMSPRLVIKQAETMKNALVEIDPEGADYYNDNYSSFKASLEKVIAELESVLKPYEGNTVFVYHPAFGYFLDDYGLVQEAVETGGKEPTPAQLQEIIEEAQDDNVHIVFVQPEFSMQSAKIIADAIDGTVVTLNPLNRDYINNLYHMAEEVKKSF